MTDVNEVTDVNNAETSEQAWRQEHCSEMLRWAIERLRGIKCDNVPEYELQINVLGYLGNCYIAEGGTQTELRAMDTEKWLFTKSGSMPF